MSTLTRPTKPASNLYPTLVGHGNEAHLRLRLAAGWGE